MILPLSVGTVTTGVVVYGLLAIALGWEFSPLVIAGIMGAGLLMVILGATGVLTNRVRFRRSKE